MPDVMSMSGPPRRNRASPREEVEELIREAIPFHLEGLVDEGLPIPDPDSVEVGTIAV